MQDERNDWLSRMKGVALSSDAFFPFRDNIDRAAQVCSFRFTYAYVNSSGVAQSMHTVKGHRLLEFASFVASMR